MSNGAEAPPAKSKKGTGTSRAVWGVEETWALIRLWEDRLEDLRRAKRNGGIYEDISAALKASSYEKDKDQVHSKIENLTTTYR